MNPNGCMTITAEYADVRRGRFSNISSLQLPIFFAALRPFFRIISRKGAKGTRSRQANFRRGMQNAQLSTTRSLPFPVLTPSRRCVPQTTETKKPKTEDQKPRRPQAAILQSFPISLLCSFRFSLRLCDPSFGIFHAKAPREPEAAILQSLPISLLCSFRFSLRFCVNPLSEYFT